MICDGCGRDNAVIRLVVMSEGQRVEQHLCVDCAAVADLQLKDFSPVRVPHFRAARGGG